MSQMNLIPVAVACSMTALLVSGCSRQKMIEAKSDPPSSAPVTVAVARALPADLSRQMVLAAEFKPFQEIDVHAKVAGYVQKIFVDVGDHVKQGQMLAILEIPELRDDIARTQAAKRQADAELVKAQDDLQRAKSAHTVEHLSYTRLEGVMKSRPDLVAQQEIDEAEGKDREAEAQVSAAQAALSAAEQGVAVAKAEGDRVNHLYEYSRMTAPFAGIISKRYADTGSMIQAGISSNTQAMPLVRLSENGLLRLVLPVPESAVPHIHLNSPVEVRVPTLKRSFAGKVARFADTVNEDTRTMETEVDVPNPDLLLVPGMYAETILTLDQRADALAVPVQAVAGEDHPTVMVVNARHQLEERAVKLGLETSNRVEIVSGIEKGDLVVLGSRSQFHVGQTVAPKLIELAEAAGEE